MAAYPAMKAIRVLIGVLCFALLAGGAWVWQRSVGKQQIVLANLPEVPDLTAKASVLRDRVAAANARAQSRLTCANGLGELSRLYHANGFMEEAKQCYAGLEQLDPTEPRWPHLHATILAGFGDIEPAVRLWQRVIQLAPDYVPARLRLADCLLKSNQPGEAATVYNDVLIRSPGNSYALLGLARMDLEASRWDKAQERLETVVAQTNYALGYDLIVSLYERIGQRERAAAIRGSVKASGAYRDLPDPWLDALFDDCFDPYRLAVAAGTVDVQSAAAATAIRRLERAIELDPKDVSYQFQLGGIYLRQQNFPKATELFERCAKLAPEFADTWIQWSALQAQAGDNNAAEHTLAVGLSHCPNSPALHLLRARSLLAADRMTEAINEFQISIHLRPNEPDAYGELGNAYIKSGQTEEGVKKMHEALEADPGYPMALAVSAFYAISTGNERDSRYWLTRVANQPRVPREQVTALMEAYRQGFGRDFRPDKPIE
jgi:tetratricopeptide (TPR) repeat protein